MLNLVLMHICHANAIFQVWAWQVNRYNIAFNSYVHSMSEALQGQCPDFGLSFVRYVPLTLQIWQHHWPQL
jgi:hypothetical protein